MLGIRVVMGEKNRIEIEKSEKKVYKNYIFFLKLKK